MSNKKKFADTNLIQKFLRIRNPTFSNTEFLNFNNENRVFNASFLRQLGFSKPIFQNLPPH